MTDAFVLRCVLAVTIGAVCGFAIDPLWLSLLIGLAIITLIGVVADMEYQRGRQELAAEILPKITSLGQTLDGKS